MRPLTPRQHQVYEAVIAAIRYTGQPPSVRALLVMTNLRSPATIHQHLKALVKKGVLRRTWRGYEPTGIRP